MKKLWLILEILDAFLLLVGGTIGILSFVILLISSAITGSQANCVSEFCGTILGMIFNYVFPVWCFIWIINGVHAVSLLNKK